MTCGMRKRTPPTDRKTCHPFKPRGGVAQKKKSHFPQSTHVTGPYIYISALNERTW